MWYFKVYIAIHDQNYILILEKEVISIIIKLSVKKVANTVARGNIEKLYWCLIISPAPIRIFHIDLQWRI